MYNLGKVFGLLILLTVLGSCSDDEGSLSSGNGNSQNLNNRSTGASANELLSETTYTNLIIEAVYVDGFRPEASSLNNLVSFLDSRLNKSGGISIIERDIPAQPYDTYTIEEVRQVEDEFRTQFSSGNTIAVFVLFAENASASDSGNNVVLGTAYRNTSLVMYQSTIENFSGGLNQPNRVTVETAVYAHEFCHIMGLVNLGTPLTSQHEDPDNDKHCNVTNCLMQAQLESGNIFDMMSALGSGVPNLDAQCIADLQANGGK